MALKTSHNAKTDTGLNNKTEKEKTKPSTGVILWFTSLIVPFSNSNIVEAKGLFSILIILRLCIQLPVSAECKILIWLTQISG